MLLRLILSIAVILSVGTANAQLNIFRFGQIDSLQKNERRKIVVFIHTDWCKYCQLTKNTSLKNDSIVFHLNKNYYFVDLNAEEKDDIYFNNHFFKYKPTGTSVGIHELAQQLGTIEKNISYPTLCFLNPDFEIIFQYPGYINARDLFQILKKINKAH